jgi:tetratricopeptide (TPR) repeat protein
LGNVLLRRGDTERAEKCAQESLTLWSEIGERHWIGILLQLLANVASIQREYGKQKQYLEQSLAVYRDTGNRILASRCLCGMGEGARQQGKYAEAVQYYEESLVVCKELGFQLGYQIVWQLSGLGHAYIGLGDDDAAWGYLREALKESLNVRRVPIRLEILAGVAWLRAKAERYTRAAELLGLVLGHPGLSEECRRHAEPVLAMVRDSLPADELEAALARGKALDLEQVVAVLLEDQG